MLTFIVVIIKTSIYKLCHAEKTFSSYSHVLCRSTDDDDEDRRKKEKFQVFLCYKIKVS